MSYLILFLEGIITFISPCILPMIPIYISYFVGENSNNKPFFNSVSFVLGFSFIFTIMGAGAGSIGVVFSKYSREINTLSGVLMILFGLNYVGLLNISFLQKTLKLKNSIKNFNLFNSFLFGIIFAIGWTPCVGPFLGSALMIASTSSKAIEGVLMLLSYSLGLGIPFVLSSLLIDSLKGSFDFIKRNYNIINKISGSLLIIIGTFMFTGHFNRLLSILRF